MLDRDFLDRDARCRATDDTTTFVQGFGLPALLDGLPVGCAGVAPEVSFAGYIDTFAFISVPDPATLDATAITLDQRILGLGYTADPFVANVYLNTAGDPESFLGLLSDDESSSRTPGDLDGRAVLPSRVAPAGPRAPYPRPMASYAVNDAAVAHARELITARQYVVESSWGEVSPDADAQNAFLDKHSWDDYASWHLGLTEGATDETKARYGFVYGDFRRIHRMGLVACLYRAAEWRHKEVELAAHDLLQVFDRTLKK